MDKCPHVITATLYFQGKTMQADFDRCSLNHKYCIRDGGHKCKIYDEELKKHAV